MSADTKIIETRTLTHRGLTIILVHDAGDYWGWIIGTEIHLPHFRHANVCYDHARAYIDHHSTTNAQRTRS